MGRGRSVVSGRVSGVLEVLDRGEWGGEWGVGEFGGAGKGEGESLGICCVEMDVWWVGVDGAARK